MEMKFNKEKISELLELMEIPEIHQVILAKLVQAKLIFKKEVQDFYKSKYPNVLEFPEPGHRQTADNNSDKQEENKANRIDWKYKNGFFDTTRCIELPEDKQIALFQRYFEDNKEFRSEILYEFFLKKMPYSDTYENTG
jgi:hypothetical protein